MPGAMPREERPIGPLRHLLPYLGRHRSALVVGGVSVLLTNLFQVWSPWLVHQAVDHIQAGAVRTVLARDVGLIMVAVLLQALFLYSMRMPLIRVSLRMEYELRNDLFAHLVRLPASAYRPRKVGDLGLQSRLYANLAVAYCALTNRCEAEGIEAAVFCPADLEPEKLAESRGVFPEWERSIWGAEKTAARASPATASAAARSGGIRAASSSESTPGSASAAISSPSRPETIAASTPGRCRSAVTRSRTVGIGCEARPGRNRSQGDPIP